MGSEQSIETLKVRVDHIEDDMRGHREQLSSHGDALTDLRLKDATIESKLDNILEAVKNGDDNKKFNISIWVPSLLVVIGMAVTIWIAFLSPEETVPVIPEINIIIDKDSLQQAMSPGVP